MKKIEIVLRYGEHEAVIPTRTKMMSSEDFAELKPYMGISPEVELSQVMAMDLVLHMVDFAEALKRQEEGKHWSDHPPSKALRHAVLELLIKSNKAFRERVSNG